MPDLERMLLLTGSGGPSPKLEIRGAAPDVPVIDSLFADGSAGGDKVPLIFRSNPFFSSKSWICCVEN